MPCRWRKSPSADAAYRCQGSESMTTSRLLLGLMLAGCICASESRAQTAKFPDRPIKVVVGFSAGGGTDVVARILALKMSETIGQTVVVENRPGASGLIAAEAVAK